MREITYLEAIKGPLDEEMPRDRETRSEERRGGEEGGVYGGPIRSPPGTPGPAGNAPSSTARPRRWTRGRPRPTRAPLDRETRAGSRRPTAPPTPPPPRTTPGCSPPAPR